MASDFMNQGTETNKGYDEQGGYEQSFEHEGMEEGGFEKQSGGGGGAAAGGVMRVIGETLVEIGQNTKEMLVGQGDYKGEQQIGEGGGKNRRQ